MSLPRVALAGATGNIGLPILSLLLSAGYTVTALTRIGGNASKLPSNAALTIAPVNFTSTSSLIPVLQGIQVVICCFATSALGTQNPLIDACVAAGVSRYIPADFGIDTQNTLAMQLPLGITKAKTQRYLREQVLRNPGFSWTAIAVGWFLDWALNEGLTLDLVGHTATLCNGGDVPFSATTIADIARAVLGVVEHQDETKNRLIFVQSARVTQNQLIRYVKEKDGKEWDTMVKSSEEVKRELYQELEKGDDADEVVVLSKQVFVAMFTPGYGGDFSDRLDNAIVGVKGLSEEGVREVVESCL
jgi:uncharacterized protein YbjT (DUF2867 family)